ncbi:MAG: FAD-dependent oxidoreductase [Kiritimatiellae bacterium]|nr:FAD-dependent oxidoreductase [Kiritimatiellia bacterium]
MKKIVFACLTGAAALAWGGETWDVVVVGGTVRAVEAAVAAKKAGAKTLLVAPRPFLGDDVSGRLRLDAYENREPDRLPHHFKLTRTCKDAPKQWRNDDVSGLPLATLTPNYDKFRLNTLLLSNGVPFRAGTAVARAVGGGKTPHLLETWNRSGRGEIAARAVVDATGEPYLSEKQGVAFAPFKPGRRRFCRYVLNGEKPSAPGLAVDEFQNCYWAVIPGWDVRAPTNFPSFFPAQLYRCTAEFDLADDSPLALARVDAAFRNLTFGPLQVDAGDRCWPVEPLRPPAEDGGKAAAARGWFWCAEGDAERVAAQAAAFAKAHPAADGERGDVIDAPDEWPVLATADVVVAGGGTCGSPAAIAAARAGAKVVVCEFHFNLGGTQTTGLLGKYWDGNRVGFTQEIDAGVKKLGSILNQTKAEYYRREIEKAGGAILYGARVVDAEFAGADAKGRKIVSGVRVVTADGRKGSIRAKVVIDATGNADVAAAAGAPTFFGSGRPEAPILQGASVSWRDLATSVSNCEVTFADDTDAESIRRALWQTQRDYGTYRWDLAPFLGSRERRRIVGDFVVRTHDMARGRKYRDTVAVCVAGQDSHGVFSDDVLFFTTISGGRRISAPVPYRAFFPKGLSGMLVTGLGISAERDALAVMRMQADLQNEGYAAGRAAATAALAGVAPDAIDVRALQRHLVEKEILPADVLGDEDTPALSAAELKALVPQVCCATNDNLDGVWEFFAAGDAAKGVVAELARKPPYAAGTPEARHFAMLAAATGVAGCEAELANWLATPQGTNLWDAGRSSAICYGPRFSFKDEAIIALARTKYAPFGPKLAEMMRALPDDADYSHLRAIAIYLDAVPEKACAPELARILKCVKGHAQAFSDSEMPKFPKKRIHPPAKELMVARALFRLGDVDGLAKSVLESYRNEPVKVFADFAAAALRGE